MMEKLFVNRLILPEISDMKILHELVIYKKINFAITTYISLYLL